jgi:hypothetical protein
MNGSPSIDPKMVRDHDGDEEALGRAIREIQLEALKQQAKLAHARPMGQERPHRWRRRSA